MTTKYAQNAHVRESEMERRILLACYPMDRVANKCEVPFFFTQKMKELPTPSCTTSFKSLYCREKLLPWPFFLS